MISGVSSDVATDQFLTLLVTQLQNQDPLEPVGQQEFVSQLAEFSTLSGIEELNEGFESMLNRQSDLIRLQELSVGSDLIGKTVAYFPSGATQELREATVERISVVQGRLAVDVGEQTIGLGQIMHVVGEQTAAGGES